MYRGNFVARKRPVLERLLAVRGRATLGGVTATGNHRVGRYRLIVHGGVQDASQRSDNVLHGFRAASNQGGRSGVLGASVQPLVRCQQVSSKGR
uniref:hypothetical protein n=1 Tax=Mycobacterium avium TaxID=1764 RepID=UPI001E4F3609